MLNPFHVDSVPTPVRDARFAGVAALIASVGDLLLLYVGNAQRSELGLPEAGLTSLWLGGIAGVAAIPLYAFGYRAASVLVAEASARSARVLVLVGIAIGLLGAVIHGLTALLIATGLDAAKQASDPLGAVADSSALLTLWGVAALLALIASSLFVWFVGRGKTRAPRVAALGNPVLLTIVLAGAGLPFVLLRSFLTPAAPNIAHLIFFMVCAAVLAERAPPRTSGRS